MATPLSVSIPHQLGRSEARRRIATGFNNFIRQVPGGGQAYSERWDGDRMNFSIAAMGQSVAGAVTVFENAVTIEIELPGLLGVIANAFRQHLQKAGQLLLTRK
jgi:hypothetical protein